MRWVLLLAVFAALTTGCGKPERVPVYPVSGRVMLKGKPLAGWMVVLHPEPAPANDESPYPLPRADVDKEGRFRFHTYDYETNDGAPVGTYKISFVQMEGAKPRQVYWPSTVEVRPETNEFPPFDITPFDKE